jgi:uncharacterized membrane protein YhiD involved in acid resistance
MKYIQKQKYRRDLIINIFTILVLIIVIFLVRLQYVNFNCHEYETIYSKNIILQKKMIKNLSKNLNSLKKNYNEMTKDELDVNKKIQITVVIENTNKFFHKTTINHLKSKFKDVSIKSKFFIFKSLRSSFRLIFF